MSASILRMRWLPWSSKVAKNEGNVFFVENPDPCWWLPSWELISHRKAPLKIMFHFPKAGYISSLEGTLQHCRKNYQKHFQHGKSNPYKLLSWCFLPTNRAPPWSFQLEEFQNYISEGFLENPTFGRVNPRLGKQQPHPITTKGFSWSLKFL